jgi:hypothetical protein
VPDPAFGDYAPLKDIAGIQVCSKQVRNEGTYTVYEMNIVMSRPDGARIAAMCHGDRAALFADARKLAEFLGVPLVDHCGDVFQGKQRLSK